MAKENNNNQNNMGQNPTNQQPNMGQQPMNNQQQYQGMPQNPNMQGNPNMNQGQYNPNMNGQQPYQGQFQGQMPNQGQRPMPGQMPSNMNQGQFNNQQAYQGQYQGMPQNPNMMNPQFQGYNQAKAPNQLVMKFKELWQKNTPMMIGICVAIGVLLTVITIYMNQTKYERALKHGTFEVTGTYANEAIDAYNSYQDDDDDYDDDDDDGFGFGLFGGGDDEDDEDESSSDDNKDYKLYLAFDNNRVTSHISDHIPTATDIKNESTYSRVKVKGDTVTLDDDEYKIKKVGSSYELNGEDDSMRLTKVN